ncbi:NUDIX hydrolase [Paenibacillus stellifer]|uniref:NUDIX hydrolase n=1 Tax=Paenibacillus stellifer TaxID=169760 RepID=UPI0006925384|nr:NUDIX domain-containing protein [Paenibacillus stellifer]
MADILFKTDEHVFSYRVAGILIRNGSVLLQKPVHDPGYVVPGGHVGFGETNEETLIREFREELAADITVNGLRWVGEIFFPWGGKPCHQICLYYEVDQDGSDCRA